MLAKRKNRRCGRRISSLAFARETDLAKLRDKLAHNTKSNTPLCNLFVHMLNQMGLETEYFASSTGELKL